MSKVTAQDVRDWCEQEREGIERGLAECTDVPEFMKTMDGLRECWFAGCWLKHHLEEAKCNEEQVREICFAMGQRSLFSDAYEVAASYFNAWTETQETPEEPGLELGNRIIDELEGLT